MIEILRNIVENTPDAHGAVLMGFDGIAVAQHCTEDSAAEGVDVESIAMEFSFRFIELRNAAESLEMGELSDITIKAEKGTVLVRILDEEYFVAVVMANAKHFGKGRWMLRSNAPALHNEL